MDLLKLSAILIQFCTSLFFYKQMKQQYELCLRGAGHRTQCRVGFVTSVFQVGCLTPILPHVHCENMMQA